MRERITVRPNKDHEPIRVDGAAIGLWSYNFHGERRQGLREWVGSDRVVVETGALNELSQDAGRFIAEVREMRETLGDRLVGVDVDETMYKLKKLGWSVPAVVEAVAPFYKFCAREQIDPSPIEHWPGLEPEETQQYLEGLFSHCAITRLTLDIDWDRADGEAPRQRWYEYAAPRLYRDRVARYWADKRGLLRELVSWCHGRGIEVAVIVGSPMMRAFPRTVDGFVQCVREQRRRVLEVFEPDAWVVESWVPIPSEDVRTWPPRGAFVEAVTVLT